jgi:hypothetical protein
MKILQEPVHSAILVNPIDVLLRLRTRRVWVADRGDDRIGNYLGGSYVCTRII